MASLAAPSMAARLAAQELCCCRSRATWFSVGRLDEAPLVQACACGPCGKAAGTPWCIAAHLQGYAGLVRPAACVHGVRNRCAVLSLVRVRRWARASQAALIAARENGNLLRPVYVARQHAAAQAGLAVPGTIPGGSVPPELISLRDRLSVSLAAPPRGCRRRLRFAGHMT